MLFFFYPHRNLWVQKLEVKFCQKRHFMVAMSNHVIK